MQPNKDYIKISNETEITFTSENKIILNNNLYSLGIPVFILIVSLLSLMDGLFIKSDFPKKHLYNETSGGELKNTGKFNILSREDLSESLKDTVYTDKDNWLELRIDQQMLYQHWRDGRTEKYPVSSGNNKSGDPEALESRPGLFAIFHKEEHHQSTQFNSANMYHFMPFNQGIGFHSIDGTGYYAHLGVRPSSHGCIRMKHGDAEKLFKDSPLGTLVLATKGYSARIIAFAPKDFENNREYDKDEYKKMLANNLYNILNGRYYLEDREKFIIDPKVIPVSGVYTSYDVQIPKNQIVPRSYVAVYQDKDKIFVNQNQEIIKFDTDDEMMKFVFVDYTSEPDSKPGKLVNSTNDLVKRYFSNPIGVLPYFGPKK